MKKPLYRQRCSDCRVPLKRQEIIQGDKLCFKCIDIRIEVASNRAKGERFSGVDPDDEILSGS